MAYTLIEVLVATAITGLMLVGLYGGFASGFSVMQIARDDLRATQIMMQKVEAIRLCTWSQLSNCPISFVERYDPLGITNNTAGATYFGTITTNGASGIPSSSGYKSNICEVTVSVRWTNYNGKKAIARTRTMQTQVARYGMQNYVWGAGP